MVAMLVEELLHVPPPLPSLSNTVAPTHSPNGPVIGEGSGFTVTIFEMLQPVTGNVAVIVVTPGLTPLTIPVENPTVATPVELLLQVTPVEDVSVRVEPTHTADAPLMLEGSGFTVTVATVVQPAPTA
jgi:hypothetical protein